MKKLVSKSAKETKNFAKQLAKSVLKIKGPVILSLEGDLGAGKTTFTQGFAGGLGIKETIQSPTFVILKIYKIKKTPPKANAFRRVSKARNLIHVDAYRLQAKDFKVLGWKEFIKNSENIILVEWGNKIKNILPKNTMRMIFKHGKNSNERILSIYQ